MPRPFSKRTAAKAFGRLSTAIKGERKKLLTAIEQARRESQKKIVAQVARQARILTGMYKDSIERRASSRITKDELIVTFSGEANAPNLTSYQKTYFRQDGKASYLWMKKRRVKTAFRAEGLGSKTSGRGLAVRSMKTGRNKPKYLRSARGKVKTVRSGKNVGKRYTSAKVAAVTGPTLNDIFNHKKFREEIAAYSIEQVRLVFRRKFGE